MKSIIKQSVLAATLLTALISGPASATIEDISDLRKGKCYQATVSLGLKNTEYFIYNNETPMDFNFGRGFTVGYIADFNKSNGELTLKLVEMVKYCDELLKAPLKTKGTK